MSRGEQYRRADRDATVALVFVQDDVGDGEQHADENAEESETANTGAPPTVLLEDDREGTEQAVQDTVNDGNVDRKKEDNGS